MNVEKPYQVEVLNHQFNKELKIPGSKSITNRALIISALARGHSKLSNVLFSDDTYYMIEALSSLGVEIDINEEDKILRVHGSEGIFKAKEKKLFVGNSGTCMRFLTSFVSLGNGRYIIDGNERMRERPIKDLIEGLRQVGVDVKTLKGNGYPPVDISANGIIGGTVRMRGDVSSQYFSSILLVAPYARDKDITIEVIGRLVSRPYVMMTIRMMEQFGVQASLVDAPGALTMHISHGVQYKSRDYVIESDFSSASYFLAAAAITGSRIRLSRFPRNSLQGDAVILDVLEKMGARVMRDNDHVELQGPRKLKGIDIDLHDYSDLVPTIAIVAIFADGVTRIKNVKNIRYKETDRLRALHAELRKIGVKVIEHDAGLEIKGGEQDSLSGALINTYDDHRMAMAFSLAGLIIEDIEIENPGCTKKSFPNYFELFETLHD
ncbi:MAG: 3-phosphoshikimate 1-carboxyvinyltransferase [Promethearchaeota archaeon]